MIKREKKKSYFKPSEKKVKKPFLIISPHLSEQRVLRKTKDLPPARLMRRVRCKRA